MLLAPGFCSTKSRPQRKKLPAVSVGVRRPPLAAPSTPPLPSTKSEASSASETASVKKASSLLPEEKSGDKRKKRQKGAWPEQSG